MTASLSMDFMFRVCRGCLAAECVTPLSSVFNTPVLAEKLQVLSGVKISVEKGKNEVLMCVPCLEKLSAAFKFSETVRKLDINFFSKARRQKDSAKKAQEESSQVQTNGFALPSMPNHSTVSRETLKRKAAEIIEETRSRKLPTLESPIRFEKLPQKQEQHQENPLPDNHEPLVKIKEEKPDYPETLIIEGHPPIDNDDSEEESEDADQDPGASFDHEWHPSIPSHVSQSEFVCEMDNCGKTFTSQWHLQRHGVSHNENRPYACYCNKSYKRRSHLVRHQKKNQCMKSE